MNISQNNTAAAIIDRIFEVYGDESGPKWIVVCHRDDIFTYVHATYSRKITLSIVIASCIVENNTIAFYSHVSSKDANFNLADPNSLLQIYEYLVELHKAAAHHISPYEDRTSIKDFFMSKVWNLINIFNFFRGKL